MNHTTTTPANGTYTYTIAHAHGTQHVTLTVKGNRLASMTRDGAEANVSLLPGIEALVFAEIDQARADAQRYAFLGGTTFTFTPEPTPVIGKARATVLHADLGKIGIRDHYKFATLTLGRIVPSLAFLTAEEEHIVRFEASQLTYAKVTRWNDAYAPVRARKVAA